MTKRATCKAITKRNEPCKNPAWKGTDYCYAHRNQAAQRGQMPESGCSGCSGCWEWLVGWYETRKRKTWWFGGTLAILTGIFIIVQLIGGIAPTLDVIKNLMPTPAPTPTPLAFPTAQAGQILIIVGSFDDRSGGEVQVDVVQRTYEQLIELKRNKNLPNVRVEPLPQPLITTDEDAREIGAIYGARLIVWGWRDDAGAMMHVTSIEDEPSASATTGMEINLLSPATVPVCLGLEAPAQGTYLALFTLGRALVVWDDLERVQLASELVDAALLGIEQRPIGTQCSAFNPSSGYAIQGHLYGTIAKLLSKDAKRDVAIQWRYKAIDAYDRSISLKDDEAWVYIGKAVSQAELADLLAARGQRDEAIQMQLAAIESYDKAIASYDEALEFEPKKASAHSGRGDSQATLADLLAQGGQRDEAIQERRAAIASYDKALEFEPEDARAHYNKGYSQAALADLLAQGGQRDEAIQERLAAIDSYDKAIDSYDKALESEPKKARAHYETGYNQAALASLLAEGGQPDEAILMYRASISNFDAALSDDANCACERIWKANSQAALADLLAQEGQRDEAIQMQLAAIDSYDEALKFEPEDATAHYNKGYSQAALADLLAEGGQRDEAIQMRLAAIETYSQALNLTPNYPSANFNRGLLYHDLGEWQPMYGDFSAVIEDDPDSFGAHLWRGVAATRLGLYQQAEVDFRRVLELTTEPFYVQRATEELQRLGVHPSR